MELIRILETRLENQSTKNNKVPYESTEAFISLTILEVSKAQWLWHFLFAHTQPVHLSNLAYWIRQYCSSLKRKGMKCLRWPKMLSIHKGKSLNCPKLTCGWSPKMEGNVAGTKVAKIWPPQKGRLKFGSQKCTSPLLKCWQKVIKNSKRKPSICKQKNAASPGKLSWPLDPQSASLLLSPLSTPI